MHNSTLSDEQFQDACKKLQTLLREVYGENPTFHDLFEMLGGHLIGCAFAAFATANCYDREQIEKNRDSLLKVFETVFNVYMETYLKRGEAQQLVVDKLAEQFQEQFGAFSENMTEAQKQMVELFAKMGVDTTKMKQ